MVTIKDGCGCGPSDCNWKEKLKLAYSRAIQSVNKIGDNDGSIYYPDGTGFVKLPLPRQSDVAQIKTNAQDIADLKVRDIQLQANITAEETARKAKDENLDSDIARIDSTDARQSELIQDNADRITSTYNDLVSTEATVATHDSEIITLQANNQAIAKSLVSDVVMTDGTTAGSVQVSIEREDGALITSANYRWGKDIGIRLEAGTQEGYVKAVISLSDGTELVSNEYKIVEVLESDVYVTAITLIADQTAGTLGGNISYSNGTTQTINSVSVPTAPGVTSAIEALQGRMSAVEQKNTTQDSQISALDSRVKAIEDTPGVGQFGAGKLGTIAGSTTDGRIKAEDDGTGSVNGWSTLKQRVTTTEGQIVTAQGDISDLDGRVGTHDTEISGIMSDITAIETKNTEQDTAISGLQSSKVNIAQGVENAGKALFVGEDGNVTPTKVSSSKIPLTVCSIRPADYFIFNKTENVTKGYHAFSYMTKVGNRSNSPSEEYDCLIQANGFIGTSESINFDCLTFNANSDTTRHVAFLSDLLDKLNVDISNLPNGKYSLMFCSMISTIRPSTYQYTATITITNGVITSIVSLYGPFKFAGDSSTGYCSIGLVNFFKTA